MEGSGNTVLIQQHILLRLSRAKFDKDASAIVKYYPDRDCLARRFLRSAEAYSYELEHYIPNEIIDEYAYEQVFRQVLSLVVETFRPDAFDSYFGGLIHWLDFDFMEWLLSHQIELKRLLTWKQVCELQCNWMGWKLAKMLRPEIEEMNLRGMWEFGDERQMEAITA